MMCIHYFEHTHQLQANMLLIFLVFYSMLECGSTRLCQYIPVYILHPPPYPFWVVVADVHLFLGRWRFMCNAR